MCVKTKTENAGDKTKGLPLDDVVVYLEAARIAFADEAIFDRMAEAMNISDDEMHRLREQLTEFMCNER